VDEEVVLLKIGELTGLVSAMSLRIDTMHSDNGVRFSELISQASDIKAQIHEVKHAQNDAAQKIVILEQINKAHRESDDLQHSMLIHSQNELKQEILENRKTSTQRFEELFTLKNKFLGILIVIVSLLGLFANQIWESIGHITKLLWGK
jgi:hypothetical protein